MFFENLWEALSDALLDTLKIAAFLFLSYLLTELLEHRSGKKSENIIKNAGRIGPLIGGLIGALPQCGFSAAAAGLYAGGLLTRGTLIAVFLSTSDEMLPVMLSGMASGAVRPSQMFAVLSIKIVCAVIAGFAIDLIFKKRAPEQHIGELCEHEGCSCGEHGIFISSLLHTAKVALFILLTTLAINLAVIYIGLDNIGAVLHSVPVVGELVAAAVGLIPNCASSVVITELYIGGAITASELLSGLFVGAGVGLLVLFRTNRNIKENLIITAMLYFSGVLFGLLVGATGLASLFGL